MVLSKTAAAKARARGVLKSTKTSKGQKAAARKVIFGGSKKASKKGNPNGKGTLKQVGQFFGLGKRLGSKAAATRLAQNTVIAPIQAATSGAGYAVFEAATLPIALRAKAGRLNIPVGASQVFGAWLLALLPDNGKGAMGGLMRGFKSVGLSGISIETYSMVAKTQTLQRLRVGAANLLNRAIPLTSNNGGNN